MTLRTVLIEYPDGREGPRATGIEVDDGNIRVPGALGRARLARPEFGTGHLPDDGKVGLAGQGRGQRSPEQHHIGNQQYVDHDKPSHAALRLRLAPGRWPGATGDA